MARCFLGQLLGRCTAESRCTASGPCPDRRASVGTEVISFDERLVLKGFWWNLFGIKKFAHINSQLNWELLRFFWFPEVNTSYTKRLLGLSWEGGLCGSVYHWSLLFHEDDDLVVLSQFYFFGGETLRKSQNQFQNKMTTLRHHRFSMI